MGNHTALKLMGICINSDLFPCRIGPVGRVSFCLPLDALDGDQHLMPEAAASPHVIVGPPIFSYYDEWIQGENGMQR